MSWIEPPRALQIRTLARNSLVVHERERQFRLKIGLLEVTQLEGLQLRRIRNDKVHKSAAEILGDILNFQNKKITAEGLHLEEEL